MNLRKYIAFDFAVGSIVFFAAAVYLIYHEIAKYTGWESIKYDMTNENLIPFIILFACASFAFGVISVILFRKKR